MEFDLNSRTIDLWKSVHKKQSWDDNLFPTTNAVAFYKYHLQEKINKSDRQIRILDIGCGTGINSIYFSQNGCEVYGIDISQEALGLAIKKSDSLGLCINFKKCSFTDLNFNNDEFDAVFCDGVLYYGSEYSFSKGIDEMYRFLKSKGIARIYTKSDKDVWAHPDQEVAPHNFTVNLGYEVGMLIFAPPLKKLKKILNKFTNVIIGVEQFNYVGLDCLKSFWVITADKD